MFTRNGRIPKREGGDDRYARSNGRGHDGRRQEGGEGVELAPPRHRLVFGTGLRVFDR